MDMYSTDLSCSAPPSVPLQSPVASCSHIILYFAVLCRNNGNVVIKLYFHYEMDLRPFTCLGHYLNGFTSKKRLFSCISRSFVENELTSFGLKILFASLAILLLSGRTYQIMDAFKTCLKIWGPFLGLVEVLLRHVYFSRWWLMRMQLQKITSINHPFIVLFCTTMRDFPQPLVCTWIR